MHMQKYKSACTVNCVLSCVHAAYSPKTCCPVGSKSPGFTKVFKHDVKELVRSIMRLHAEKSMEGSDWATAAEFRDVVMEPRGNAVLIKS